MKRLPYLLTVIIIFLHSYCSFSLDNNFVFEPELSKQYIYEIVHLEFVPLENGERYTDGKRKRRLQIQYKAVPPGNQNYLFVSVIENVVQRPDFTPVHYLDYRYPLFKDGFNNNTNDNYFEELLSTVVYQYELDSEKKEVKLHNRSDVLQKVRETLNKKGFDIKGIDRHTSNFNTHGIPQISKYLQKIFFVSEEMIKEANDELSSFNRKISHQGSLVTVVYEREGKSHGVLHSEYSYNPKEMVLNSYHIVKADTLRWPAIVFNRKIKQFFQEETVQLVSMKDIPEGKLYISGVIENVRNTKVTIGVLRNPFGTELHLETALLDKHNAFNIETDFAHAGIVHLQFGQAPDGKALPMLMFYAEPGSRIHLEIDGQAYPQNVEFHGNYSR